MNKKPIYRYDIAQRTDEWYAIRHGKMSASSANIIQANGKGLETYIYSLMADYYSNGEKEHYTSADMQRGIDLEDEARTEFEFYTGLSVNEVGFVEYSPECGCSPDGLIDKDGLIEIKCPKDEIYFRLLLDGKIKPEYIAQMQMQLFVTRRKYCYFVSYNPNFEKTLFIKKIKRDKQMIDKIKEGIDCGTKLIRKIKKEYEIIKGEKYQW